MKRKGLFILCALISLTLCACGGGSKADPYEPSYEEESSSETVPDSTAAGSDEGITDDGETWEEEKARLEEEHRRRMEEQAAQEQSIRQMLEEQAAYESDSYEDEAEEGAAESDVAGENICPDCGFERLEVTCGLCSEPEILHLALDAGGPALYAETVSIPLLSRLPPRNIWRIVGESRKNVRQMSWRRVGRRVFQLRWNRNIRPYRILWFRLGWRHLLYNQAVYVLRGRGTTLYAVRRRWICR